MAGKCQEAGFFSRVGGDEWDRARCCFSRNGVMADGWKKRQSKEDESSFLMHGKESCILRSMMVCLERWGMLSRDISEKHCLCRSAVLAKRLVHRKSPALSEPLLAGGLGRWSQKAGWADEADIKNGNDRDSGSLFVEVVKNAEKSRQSKAASRKKQESEAPNLTAMINRKGSCDLPS